MFEFFGFQGRVDAIDHVIVRLLFLLLHLWKLLKVLLVAVTNKVKSVKSLKLSCLFWHKMNSGAVIIPNQSHSLLLLTSSFCCLACRQRRRQAVELLRFLGLSFCWKSSASFLLHVLEFGPLLEYAPGKFNDGFSSCTGESYCHHFAFFSRRQSLLCWISRTPGCLP